MGRWSKALAKGLAAWGALAGMAVAADFPQRQPLENFTRYEAISSVTISPSGRHLAVLLVGAGGMRKLAVMNLDPVGEARLLADYSDADVDRVQWVNDERLVYEVYQREVEIRHGGASTFAVNLDGSDERRLITWDYGGVVETKSTLIASRVLPYGWFLDTAVLDGSADVLVYKRSRDAVGDVKELLLSRLNTKTRELRSLSMGMPEGTRNWLLDERREPRVAIAHAKGRTKIHWRATVDVPWQEVAEFAELSRDSFYPWALDNDGRILVRAVQIGDTEGIYRFDPRTRKLDSEPLMVVKGFDLHPVAEMDYQTRKLLGVHFRTDRPVSYWFDDKMARLQKSVDAALPAGRNNRLMCGNCETTKFFVIESTSDRQPGEYFLLDREKMAIQRIGARRPWIQEAEQGRRTFHRVTARDGLPLPVYVTHPANARPDQALPAVVLVHGGPWLRGADTNWSEDAQFLASRGYRVIEPEFRGSTGYGSRHFEAGWKQWGRAMQDDLVDAVRWASQQGLIDANRVCITGASYGGYAALMGPIASPGVYRCAASFAGVTDIGLIFDISWSDMSQEYLKYGAPVLVGDPKDRAWLDQVSPLKRAADIKVPVFVAQGVLDRRVPQKHAREFVSAAADAGVSVETKYYPDEAHGFLLQEDRADYYQRLERFLDRNLQPRP